MAKKQVLMLFSHNPIGTIHYAEGLRLAMGVSTMAKDEHVVEIAYIGDGVNFALQGVDRAGAIPFLSTLLRVGCVPKVEAESLASRNIRRDEVATDMEIVNRRQVREIMQQSDFILDF